MFLRTMNNLHTLMRLKKEAKDQIRALEQSEQLKEKQGRLTTVPRPTLTERNKSS